MRCKKRKTLALRPGNVISTPPNIVLKNPLLKEGVSKEGDEEVVSWLMSRESPAGPACFDLKNMRRGCELLGNPEKTIPCIHVGGTNGKGSVCVKIAKALEFSHYKVGLYTSPHITSFCERIQINSTLISEHEFARLITHVKEKVLDISAFEAMTLAAFLWYRENRVDFVVMEVGLGGRLDATNVCHPLLSIITSISFDHTSLLGNTLETIALEKAGIIKKGIPVVIGPRVPVHVIEKKAKEMDAPLHRVEGYFEDFNEENNAVARCGIALLGGFDNNVVERALEFRPPCRFEKIPETLVRKKYGNRASEVFLDAAHNPDAIEKLLQKCEHMFGHKKRVFLCAMSVDKDRRAMLKSLLGSAEAIVCTQAVCERASLAEDLAVLSLEISRESIVYVEKNIEKAVGLAIGIAQEREVPLIVTGTFFFMADVRNIFFDTQEVPCVQEGKCL